MNCRISGKVQSKLCDYGSVCNISVSVSSSGPPALLGLPPALFQKTVIRHDTEGFPCCNPNIL